MKSWAAEQALLSEDPESKKLYRTMTEETTEAILRSLQSGKAYSGKTPEELKAMIAGPLLPEKGKGFEAVLKEAEEKILPGLVRPSSDCYMAHLHSPGLMESLAAEQIIAAYNQSMDSWDQSPAATELEAQVCRQLCELYGYGSRADGCFTSGGSQSNLTAIFLARDWFCTHALGRDARKHGLPSDGNRMRLYTSEISHFSMEKSCHLLGLGYDSVRKVPVDSRCRMDARALRKMLADDKKAGLRPFCIVATIGTTDFGSIDPVDEMRDIASEYGCWLHADAAYGSAAVLSDTYRSRLGNLSLADSITVDFHKMFLLPISCSVVLVKDGEDFSPCLLHADYLNREEDEEEGFINLVGKSLQTTRRFDALKVWMAFQTRGKEGMQDIVDTVIGNARHAWEYLRKDSAFEVAAEPELSSVVFRLRGGDEVNKKVRRRLLLSGTVIGQTAYQGKTWLKFTLLNPRVTHAHLDDLFALIKAEARG